MLIPMYSAIPASALNEEEDDEDGETVGESRDDERSGARYNVSSYPFRCLISSSHCSTH